MKSEGSLQINKTIAIIKPNLYKNCENIEAAIQGEGYEIIERKVVHVTENQARQLDPSLVESLGHGPMVVLILGKENAVSAWKDAISTNVPDSLQDVVKENGLYGSESEEKANRMIDFFFNTDVVKAETGPEFPIAETDETAGTGDQQGKQAVVEQAPRDYLNQHVNPLLLQGLTQLCKVKPEDPVIWLADWLLLNNPNVAHAVPTNN